MSAGNCFALAAGALAHSGCVAEHVAVVSESLLEDREMAGVNDEGCGLDADFGWGAPKFGGVGVRSVVGGVWCGGIGLLGHNPPRHANTLGHNPLHKVTALGQDPLRKVDTSGHEPLRRVNALRHKPPREVATFGHEPPREVDALGHNPPRQADAFGYSPSREVDAFGHSPSREVDARGYGAVEGGHEWPRRPLWGLSGRCADLPGHSGGQVVERRFGSQGER
ncbi:hypothetical protein GCM10009560_52000 [Nonomuraea longicatena]|uniref:Uncharacterized protein n=1 Tax=Nonomuraea longicatena TaxID=83682 RepID=A0ABP4ASC3_9ACTN